MEKFYEKLNKVLVDLGILMPEFRYNPKTLEYYSLETTTINDAQYSIVVPEDGSIQYGDIEDDKFYSKGILGYVFL